MNVFWDTSTILSVVLNDSRARTAENLLFETRFRPVTSALVALEAENRLAAMRFDNLINATVSVSLMATLDSIFASRLIPVRNIRDTRLIAAEGCRRIRHFSTARPHKTMDLVHVACARLMKAEAFFTFDSNQSALAEAAGFVVTFS